MRDMTLIAALGLIVLAPHLGAAHHGWIGVISCGRLLAYF